MTRLDWNDSHYHFHYQLSFPTKLYLLYTQRATFAYGKVKYLIPRPDRSDICGGVLNSIQELKLWI